MFNFTKLKVSRPSLRLFLFILFGLVILILIAEGGYYYFSLKKKEAKSTITDSDWINLIEGEINEIRGRTLIITVVNDFDSPIPIHEEVEIEVISEAEIFTVEGLEEMQAILFTDLKIGDIIQAGSLTRLAERKFEAKSIALMVNR